MAKKKQTPKGEIKKKGNVVPKSDTGNNNDVFEFLDNLERSFNIEVIQEQILCYIQQAIINIPVVVIDESIISSIAQSIDSETEEVWYGFWELYNQDYFRHVCSQVFLINPELIKYDNDSLKDKANLMWMEF